MGIILVAVVVVVVQYKEAKKKKGMNDEGKFYFRMFNYGRGRLGKREEAEREFPGLGHCDYYLVI